MLGIAELAVRGQQIRHAADLAAAHRVGLPGERERSRAGAADVASREVQIDERAVLVRAIHRLVEALAVERQRGACLGEHARGLDDLFDR